MTTSRRGFLGALGAAIAGAAFDPDLALWKPGARLFSIPAPRNVLLWPAAYSRSMLVTLHDQMMVTRALNGYYDALFRCPNPPKIGDTIAVRRPARFRSRDL